MQDVSEPDTQIGTNAEPFDVGRSATAQIVAQQAAIAHIGQIALVADSLDALFADTSALVARVLEAEYVSVLELSEDKSTLKVISGQGWRPGVVGELVVGSGADSLSGFTLSTGGPLIVTDMTGEKRFRVHALLVESNVNSGLSVRIGDLESPYGVLAAFSSRTERFTREDANFLQAAANVLAAAVSRFRAESELRASRDQLAAIVSTIDEGITVTDRTGLIFANDAAAQITGYATAEELLSAGRAVVGRYDLFDEKGDPMPVEALPSRRAMAGEDHAESIIGFRIHATRETRWSMARATALRDDAGNVTHVINTFREVTDERFTRQARSFMAEAVEVLSSTLDANEAARRLAELVVPRLADYCTVHMRDPDGIVANVALAHSDPAKVDIARRLQALRPPDPEGPRGMGPVLREGASQMAEITPEMIEAAAPTLSSDELDLLRQLDMHWYIAVPLLGRSEPIGALTLVMAESGRSVGDRDLELAKELGARAGIALENARLFQTAVDRRAQLDVVLGALAEGVLVFSGEGQLQLSNDAAREMFAGNVPLNEADLRDRFSPALEEDAEPQEAQLQDSGRWIEVSRYVALRAGAETEGHHAPAVVLLRDVTAARGARATRDAFLGVLSHELRTPITTIYGGSELLERGLTDERRQEVMNDIRVESGRLARLVEDLLVMTRIERGTVEISDEPILVQRLLPSVVQSFNTQWPSVEVTLSLSERLSAVRGDPTYVEQVVRNLLMNAVRYGRAAELGIEIAASEGEGEVCVRVLDRGQGIADGETEKLFELFYRSAAARAVPGGAGIGLFVCRNLIEAMGGTLWAMNWPDGGAEFGFTLPVVESDI